MTAHLRGRPLLAGTRRFGWFDSFLGDSSTVQRESPEPEVDRGAIVVGAVELAHRRADFGVQRRQSAIEGGGFGVFMQGRAGPGVAVVLYPGRYTPAPPSWAVTIDGRVDYDDKKSYIINARHTGGFLDGFEVEEELHKGNPYAIGQFVNHPRAGGLPNVVPVDFSYVTPLPCNHPALVHCFISSTTAALPLPC